MSEVFLPSQIGQYDITLDIAASAGAVWNALTSAIDKWWLPSFRMLGESSVVEIEPFAGGRLFEKAGGRELLWFTVIAIDTERSMDLVGYCTAKFGGPLMTMISIEVTSVTEHSSRLLFSDSLVGRVTDESICCTRDGWKELFENGLRAYAESRNTH